MTTEEIYIKKIEGCTRAIRLGTKQPIEIANEIASAFISLKMLNEGLHTDLMTKYKNVLEDSKNRK